MEKGKRKEKRRGTILQKSRAMTIVLVLLYQWKACIPMTTFVHTWPVAYNKTPLYIYIYVYISTPHMQSISFYHSLPLVDNNITYQSKQVGCCLLVMITINGLFIINDNNHSTVCFFELKSIDI